MPIYSHEFVRVLFAERLTIRETIDRLRTGTLGRFLTSRQREAAINARLEAEAEVSALIGEVSRYGNYPILRPHTDPRAAPAIRVRFPSISYRAEATARVVKWSAVAVLVIGGLGWPPGVEGKALAGTASVRPEPIVEVTNTSVAPIYHFDAEVPLMASKLRRHGNPENVHDLDAVRGLTYATLLTWTIFDLRMVEPKNGLVQMSIIRARFLIGYNKISVFIASYPEESCERREVLKHENIHVSIALNTLKAAIPELTAALHAAVAVNQGIVRGRTVEEARAVAIDRLEAALSPVVAKLNAETRRLNEALDSPASYKRTGDACPVWHKPSSLRYYNGGVLTGAVAAVRGGSSITNGGFKFRSEHPGTVFLICRPIRLTVS